jgi:hypothetical protein
VRHVMIVLAALALTATPACSQGTTPAPAAVPQAAPAAPAARAPLDVAQQIASAVLPLPAEMRPGATVLGYGADGKLGTLRAGGGTMTCLASDPKVERFHVACYHRSLEPFMARGRELRARGVVGEQVDSVRYAEAKAGKLALPKEPAVLYSLTGAPGAFDPVTGTAPDARRLYVVYIPYATAESTGLSAQPAQGQPWIMFPGTPKAHIMFTPRMGP